MRHRVGVLFGSIGFLVWCIGMAHLAVAAQRESLTLTIAGVRWLGAACLPGAVGFWLLRHRRRRRPAPRPASPPPPQHRAERPLFNEWRRPPPTSH